MSVSLKDPHGERSADSGPLSTLGGFFLTEKVEVALGVHF